MPPHFILTYDHNGSWQDETSVRVPFDDGEWHHCADVYDATSG